MLFYMLSGLEWAYKSIIENNPRRSYVSILE